MGKRQLKLLLLVTLGVQLGCAAQMPSDGADAMSAAIGRLVKTVPVAPWSHRQALRWAGHRALAPRNEIPRPARVSASR